MKDLPFVTVFTPNYNKEKFLPETIESILNQTYRNFEYIIVDDCSTDDSWTIIQEFAKKDTRVRVYRNESNLKIVKTRNRGLTLSSDKAKYFAIIDSDDVAIAERLSTQIDFLENNSDYGLVGSNAIIIDENSKEIGFRKYPLSDSKIRRVITRLNPFTQSSIMIRKKVIEELGLYDEKWSVCQDYDYWLRVGQNWKFENIEEPLVKYRLSSSQVKRSQLKETIQNTYFIQKKAIKEYEYKDRLFNKFFRLLLRLSFVYPKIAYYAYKVIIK